jgi:hypothetical protein
MKVYSMAKYRHSGWLLGDAIISFAILIHDVEKIPENTEGYGYLKSEKFRVSIPLNHGLNDFIFIHPTFASASQKHNPYPYPSNCFLF